MRSRLDYEGQVTEEAVLEDSRFEKPQSRPKTPKPGFTRKNVNGSSKKHGKKKSTSQQERFSKQSRRERLEDLFLDLSSTSDRSRSNVRRISSHGRGQSSLVRCRRLWSTPNTSGILRLEHIRRASSSNFGRWTKSTE